MGLIDEFVPVGGLVAAIAGLAANIDGSSGSAMSTTRALLRSGRPVFRTAPAAEPMVSSFVSGDVAAAAARFTALKGAHAGPGPTTAETRESERQDEVRTEERRRAR